MRIVFSVLGLLIVLAIIGSVAKKQLQALRTLPQTSTAAGASAAGTAPQGERGGRLDAFPGAVSADTSGLTVPQQSQTMQREVANQVQQQLQQGAARSAAGGGQ